MHLGRGQSAGAGRAGAHLEFALVGPVLLLKAPAEFDVLLHERLAERVVRRLAVFAGDRALQLRAKWPPHTRVTSERSRALHVSVSYELL